LWFNGFRLKKAGRSGGWSTLVGEVLREQFGGESIHQLTDSLIVTISDNGSMPISCDFLCTDCVRISIFKQRKKDIYLKGSEDQLFLGPMLRKVV
jgi:hypothetical protein